MLRRGSSGGGPADQDPLAGWSRLPALNQAALTVAAYLAACLLAQTLADPGHAVFPFWPAAGVGLVALLLSPARRWPLLCVAVGVASAGFGLIRGVSPAYALGLAGADALAALAGAATTLALTHGRRPNWQRLPHVWATILGGGVTGPVLGGLAGAALAAASGDLGFGRAWLQWTAGASVGALLVGGLFLSAPTDGRLRLLPERRLEVAACMLAAGLLTSLSLGFTSLPVTWLAWLPLFWAALRLEPIGTAFTVCVIGIVSTALTAEGLGIYASVGHSVEDALLLAQGSLFVAIAFGASQAALMAGQARAAERLRASQEELREAQKMEGIGRLAGTIAHDFNNLLTVIDGYGRLGREQAEDGGDPRESLDEIVAAGRRGRALTGRLLTFSRARPARRHPLELDAAIGSLREQLAEPLGDRHELVLRLNAPDCTVAIDEEGLAEALRQLVANARDAMPLGGRIEVETGAVTLPEGGWPPHPPVPAGRWVVLTVRDAGLGMAASIRQRALEPFFTTKLPAPGTGLGLAVVYGIVEQAGGRLAIDTAPGRGTVVRLYLPAAGLPARAPAEVRTPTGTEAGSETVLLAEDEPSLRVLCRTLLEQRGYAVLAAGDGVEALEIADAHDGEIDLLVTDIVMPGMGGPELHRHLAERRPGVRVLFTSGYAQRELTPSSVLDRDNFLPKPYTPAELVRRVRAVLDDAAVS